MQDLEMISGKNTNETLFSREQHSRNNLKFFYLLAWCTSNLFKQGFCQMSKKNVNAIQGMLSKGIYAELEPTRKP